jgi:DNA-directed RNA polymerase subunit L
MRLKIKTNEDDRIEIIFGGEGHTLLNLLQSSLLKDKYVEMAGYSKPHPLMDRSILFVKMKKKNDPIEALKRSAADAKEKVNEFLKKFDKQITKKA